MMRKWPEVLIASILLVNAVHIECPLRNGDQPPHLVLAARQTSIFCDLAGQAGVFLTDTETAHGQHGQYFLESLPQLNADDIARMKRTAREEMDGKPEGTTLQWRSAASGNAGTVTLLRRFTRSGGECRQVQHDLDLVTQGSQRRGDA